MHNLHIKSISALLALSAVAFAACSKMNVSSSGIAGRPIEFSVSLKGMETKAASASVQCFNVLAYTAGSEDVYFSSSKYSYDEASSCYVTEEKRYWPKAADLEFYAFSPSTYLDTTDAEKPLTAGKTLDIEGLDGSTDILATKRLADNGPGNVILDFEHILTRISFLAIGETSGLKYEITGISVSAGSSSSYSMETEGSWTAAEDIHNYPVLDSVTEIPAGTKKGIKAGKSLFLIPEQESVTANVKYKVYDGETLFDDKSTNGITLPIDASKWGRGQSIIYTLVLGAGNNTISFSGVFNGWEDDISTNLIIPPKPIKFEADAAQTISLSNTSNTPNIEYSWDGESWTSWSYSALSFGAGTGHPCVYFRGMNTSGFSKGQNNFSSFTFGDASVGVKCTGNIMALINYHETLATIPCSRCFYKLFVETPLASAPALPATTLAADCYMTMFYGCSMLQEAPTLPATTLAEHCYQWMFGLCTSLTEAPSLPATSLKGYCYCNMFNGCTALKKAPDLPATTLASICYAGMFDGCSQLNEVKAMFTTTPSTSYTENWLRGVSSSGTFIKNSAATWDVSGVHGIPSGWTVTSASE